MRYPGYIPVLVQCGCWYVLPSDRHQKRYLPQVELESATTILSCTARTKLVQTFTNTEDLEIPKAQYTFPLYDGVSVVSFKCKVGDRTIFGVVKEKHQARADYQTAVEQGQTAGLLEQFQEAGDVFTTKIGNIPAGSKVMVEIVYLGELRHDAEKDGVRFTIPTVIAPRYGLYSNDSQSKMFGLSNVAQPNGIKILVDVAMEEGAAIRGLQSPSHPIAVTLGRNSVHEEDVFQSNLASATLALSGKAELGSDFVIIVNAQGQDTPRALFETHDALPNQRALMTTLVPKFNLPNSNPEIMFMVDRSGSMQGQMPLVVKALRIFLKSLPMSAKFNICSFGSHHTFLFKNSKPYDEASLKEASAHLDYFEADYGGTEILKAMKDAVKQRLDNNTPLEIMILTDGEIWNQDDLFDFTNTAAKAKIRVFSLGIGSGASTSLVEGLARAGNGFAQFVSDGEQIDKRVVRMLKAAMMPCIDDYSLEVVYGPEDGSDDDDDDGFTLVESFEDSMKIVGENIEQQKPKQKPMQKVISLFTPNFKDEKPADEKAGRYDHLPNIPVPKILQAPYSIPQLYPFNRTTVYLLFGPDSCQRCPKKVVLRGTSEHGPLELEIPVQDVGKGEMIHQLAAKKMIQDLEEGRGWLIGEKQSKANWLNKNAGDWDRIVERETVRLGTTFQVAGKFCSFIAVEDKDQLTDEDVDVDSGVEKNKPALGASAPKLSPSQVKWRFVKAKDTSQSATYGSPILYKEQEEDSAGYDKRSRATGHSPVTVSQSIIGSSGAVFPQTSLRRSAAPPAPAARARKESAYFKTASLFTNIGGGGRGGGLMSKPSPNALFGAARGGASSARVPFPPPPSFSAPTTMSAYAPSSSVYSEPVQQSQHVDAKKVVFECYEPMSDAASIPLADEDDEMMDNSAHEGTLDSGMDAVIGLQEFDGSWKNVTGLLATTGISHQKFSTALATVKSDTVKATILAIAWLEAKAGDERETWEMVVDKAKAWTSAQGHDDVGSLVKLAKEAFFSSIIAGL